MSRPGDQGGTGHPIRRRRTRAAAHQVGLLRSADTALEPLALALLHPSGVPDRPLVDCPIVVLSLLAWCDGAPSGPA